jgi:hypothetical protein
MAAKLSVEVRDAFKEISYSIGDGKPHKLEDIKGVPIPKDKIPELMLIFTTTDPPLYIFDGTYYTITRIGTHEFKKMRDSLEKVAPGRLVY